MSRTPQEQLVHFLSDMYSVEQQALAQLSSAPKVAGDPALAEHFRQHHHETEQQADMVRERLEALGGSPSAVKDAVMALGGKGFLLFARVQPETPGRLLDHAYAYEAMEWAGYEMLIRFADRAGDVPSVEMAKSIRSEERAMMERLQQCFDAVEYLAHSGLSPEQVALHVRKHLVEVHAFEKQGVELLKKSDDIGGDPSLDGLYSRHLIRIREHAQRIEQRLADLGTSESTLKDSALGLGGMNWGLFFQAQSDTPAKLAAFVYAFYFLEIGGHELLKRTADRIGDHDTARLCGEVIQEKQAMADELAQVFDAAVEATLDKLQVV